MSDIPPITSATIRLVLVGCGRIADRHFDAIEAIPELEIVAVCDEMAERARAAGERLGVPAFSNYGAMLAETDAHASIICTPSGLHPRHGILAAERGLHVISEKPMATRLEDADALVRACDDANVHLFVVKQNRLNPSIELLKAAVEKGRFGRIYLANTTVRWQRPRS